MKNLIHKYLNSTKGSAIIVALALLLLVSLIISIFMMTTVSNNQIDSRKIFSIKAINIAESGVSEAAARLADVGPAHIAERGAPSSANWKAVILNNTDLPKNTGSVKYFSSIQAGIKNALPYTVSSLNGKNAKYVLMVEYKTDTAGSGIYYYNFLSGSQYLVKGPPFAEPSVENAPIWIIHASGKVGDVRKNLNVELCQVPVECNIPAAFCSQGQVTIGGRTVVSGHNHFFDNPDSVFCGMDENSCGNSGCIAALAVPRNQLTIEDPNLVAGYPVEGIDIAGVNLTLWQVLDCADSLEMYRKFKITHAVTAADINSNPNGFIIYNGDLLTSDIDATNAHGILWIKGNFNINSAFKYSGLIYVGGALTVSEPFQLSGACLVKGAAEIKAAYGESRIMFSGSNIMNEISGSLQSSLIYLGWKETIF